MNFKYENQKRKQGFDYIIGCDEVGRGCLAGSVVAAAVMFPVQFLNRKSLISNLKSVKDSKLLTAEKREELSTIIEKVASWSIGVVSQEAIDEINIHNATLRAMRKAVEGLFAPPGVIPSATEESLITTTKGKGSLRSSSVALLVGRDDTKKVFVAIDGKFVISNFNIEQQAVVGGDNKILSIAAASIIAKVYRDDLMRKLDKDYPIYNFAQHKGYGTLFHRTMILKNGLSPIHRKSFCKNLAPI
jgi:ribonuclease HII